ncbi:MAG: signal recognition particle receptor subunit alpha, partial [Nitrospirota bacterium]|nr:signal recognition particle receptor subunit alpha [Nitrospirota bacterium]
MGLFDRLKEGLAKTRKGFIEKVESVLMYGTIDEEVVNELEEILITSDIGVHAAAEIVNSLKDKIKKGEVKDSASAKEFLKKEMVSLLGSSSPVVLFGEKPFVILTIGVNGVGKTTTIGKLASRFRS